MARHKTDTVDYFSHPCKNGTRMYIMEQNYGDKGYVAYYKLLELLGAAEGHYLDFNKDKHRLFFAASIRADVELMSKIIFTLADIEAIDKHLWVEHQIIWCQEFVDNLKDLYDKRRRKPPTKPHFHPENGTLIEQFTPEIPQSKVKESKVKESKVKETLLNENDLISEFDSRNGVCFYDSKTLIAEVENSKWLEDVGRVLKIPDKEIKKKFSDFAEQQQILDGLGRNLKDIKQHFFNQTKKYLANDTSKKNIGPAFKPGGAGTL